jgi:predicted transcriptional regulator
MSTPSTRINLTVPLDLAIQIERDSDKRGIGKVQFIKEAIYEKLKRGETKEERNEYEQLREEVIEIKRILMILLEVYNTKQ